MPKIVISIVVIGAFLFGVAFNQIYTERKASQLLAKQPKISKSGTSTNREPDIIPRFTDPAAKVAFYCSRTESCEALLNNGKKVKLRLIGDVEKTWIMLDDKKIPSQLFYEKYYRGTFPDAVAYIHLPD